MRTVVLLCLLTLSTGGCLFPETAVNWPADSTCQTGAFAGFDIAIWDCHVGNRIVAYRFTSEWTMTPVVTERTLCGEPTPLEHRLSDDARDVVERDDLTEEEFLYGEHQLIGIGECDILWTADAPAFLR